jgi:phosphoribosylglycinamide formyltransferase-1
LHFAFSFKLSAFIMSSKSRIAIFASGSGSNAEEIIKYFKDHTTIEVVLLLSNNNDAFALERAKKFNIPTKVFSREQYKESDDILHWLRERNATHIVLAGFLWLIPDYLIKNFPDRIVNIHPALLPKFGGKGMYGMRVHEAVKSAGETETGITIHLVNEHYDDGKILFQGRCDVDASATPAEIAACVHKLEYEFYPKAIEKWILGS